VHIEQSDEFESGRKVTEISLLKGYDYDKQEFVIEDLYRFNKK
jgi:hypothetical protein